MQGDDDVHCSGEQVGLALAGIVDVRVLTRNRSCKDRRLVAEVAVHGALGDAGHRGNALDGSSGEPDISKRVDSDVENLVASFGALGVTGSPTSARLLHQVPCYRAGKLMLR